MRGAKRSQEGLARHGVSSVFAHRARGVEDWDPMRALLRGLDYFPTQPWAARALAELVRNIDPRARSAWEPAAGEAVMAHGLADYFDRLVLSDVHDYGVGAQVVDFLANDAEPPGGEPVDWICTNPPFKDAKRFVQLARQRARRGVVMFVRLGFQESVGRFELFSGPGRATMACPYSERVGIRLGDCGDGDSTAMAYMAVVWVTDPELARDFPDDTILRPFPPGTKARLTRQGDATFLSRLRATRRARLLPEAA